MFNHMSRLLVAVVAAAIGLALHFTLGWKYLAFLAALGLFGLVDRLGWIPGPYRRATNDMFRGGDDRAARREDRFNSRSR